MWNILNRLSEFRSTVSRLIIRLELGYLTQGSQSGAVQAEALT